MSETKEPIRTVKAGNIGGAVKAAKAVGSCTVCTVPGNTRVAEIAIGSLTPRLCRKCLRDLGACVDRLLKFWRDNP